MKFSNAKKGGVKERMWIISVYLLTPSRIWNVLVFTFRNEGRCHLFHLQKANQKRPCQNNWWERADLVHRLRQAIKYRNSFIRLFQWLKSPRLLALQKAALSVELCLLRLLLSCTTEQQLRWSQQTRRSHLRSLIRLFFQLLEHCDHEIKTNIWVEH